MSRFLSFFAMQCQLAARSKIALFWSFGYPVAMLLLMLSVFGGINRTGANASDPRLLTLTGVYVITIMSGGIFALATVLSADFITGVYERLKLTDLKPSEVILALILRQFVIIILGAILVMVLAKLIFSVTPHGDFASVLLLTTVGSIMSCSIGILVANLCSRPATATAIANAIFLVMLFLSGSTFPKAFFPGWLLTGAQILPASHLFDLLASQLYDGDSLADSVKSLSILLAMSAVLLIAAVKTFKWK
jgi:ABC-2 type transport system permease protein